MWLIIIFCGFLFACNDELLEPIDYNLNDHQLFLKEVSILFGKSITDPEAREELKEWMRKADPNGQLMSFAYLFGDESKYKLNEKGRSEKVFENGFVRPAFVEKMQEIFENNEDEFTHLYRSTREMTMVQPNLKNSGSRELFDLLTNLLINEQYQIFYPFDPEFENDDLTIPFFYTSYDPLDGSTVNEGFLFNNGADDFERIPSLNNDFLDVNPVFLIVPIDPCDIEGQPCNSILLISDFEIGYPGDPTNPGNPGGPGGDLPPPANGGATLLTYNVNHNNMLDDRDMITTRVAKIRVRGTDWMGFGATHQKLQFMRGAGEGTISISNGQIVADGLSFMVGPEVKISRRNCRKERWVNANLNFDADWRMSKNSQAFAVFSKHHLVFSTGKVTAGFKSGYKVNPAGEIESYQEISGSGSLDIQLDAAKFRSNVELSRRQVLITIVGQNSTYTYSDGGVLYNVKDIGIVDFYFKHWHTSFAD